MIYNSMTDSASRPTVTNIARSTHLNALALSRFDLMFNAFKDWIGLHVLTGRLISAHGETVGSESPKHHCAPTGRFIGKLAICGEKTVTSRMLPIDGTEARRTMRRPVRTQ